MPIAGNMLSAEMLIQYKNKYSICEQESVWEKPCYVNKYNIQFSSVMWIFWKLHCVCVCINTLNKNC